MPDDADVAYDTYLSFPSLPITYQHELTFVQSSTAESFAKYFNKQDYEELASEDISYRVFVVPAEVFQALDNDEEMYLAELQSPVNYTSATAEQLFEGIKYTLNPPSPTVSYTDMYGQAIQSGVAYVAFVLAVGSETEKTIRPDYPTFKNVLSGPSVSFIPGEAVAHRTGEFS